MITSKEIKFTRLELKLTQEKFAAMVGVSVTTVSRWENNKTTPHPYLEGELYEIGRKAFGIPREPG
jgi:DNA-binding transcriptional regulator YiaG